ncbi:hypothetical protein [Moraxella lacunata]|uniref:hypothetical protein n=1 Tax=Moraxella lacunata TaxID=477 RepID=UPI003EE2DC76
MNISVKFIIWGLMMVKQKSRKVVVLECCVVMNVFCIFKNIFSKNHYSFINFKIL